jgi:alkaline phosphatase
MSYTIDHANQPSLAEMTALALSLLPSDKGFFLLIEGSRIDMAAHSNDPAAHVHDVLAFNDAFRVASEWVSRSGGVVLSTSDHETGGISVGRQVGSAWPDYVWYPEVLANATHSTEYLAREVLRRDDLTDAEIREFIEETIVKDGLGITDATEDEITNLVKVKDQFTSTDFTLADMLSRRALIGVTPSCDVPNLSGPPTDTRPWT